MIRIGVLILIGAWIPLVVTGLLNPASNPIGFGLLAWLGSLIGLVIVAVGILRWAFRAFAASRGRSG